MIEINVTEFDKSENTRIEYGFEEHHFNDPISTLLELAENPSTFHQKQRKYRIVLTAKQNQEVLKYLSKNNFHWEGFGYPKDAQYLLAFSFGENPEVNIDLATIANRVSSKNSSMMIAAQWEIADILCAKNPTLENRIHRIGLDYDKEYITTIGVIDKFIEENIHIHELHEKPRIFVIAQAWHAPYCIETCNAKGLTVVGGKFSERFSPNDPQKWVRDPFSWVLKEGTKGLRVNL
jgi:hypothetical protein